MCKKSILLICVGLVLFLANAAVAGPIWTDADPCDHLWNSPGNWDTGQVPTSANDVQILGAGEAPDNPVLEGQANAHWVDVGYRCYEKNPELTVNGGTLTAARLFLGREGGPDNHGTLNMIAGAIDLSVDLVVGAWGGTGTVNMTGGTITTTTALWLPTLPTSEGHFNLHGGTISIASLQRPFGGTMDITEGTLIVRNADLVSQVKQWVADGWLTAYAGNPRAIFEIDYDVRNTGCTTVTAKIPNLALAWTPKPQDKQANAAYNAILSWSPGDYAVSHDLYLGTDFNDVNDADTSSDVFIVNTDVNNFGPLDLELDQTYYWRVDEVNQNNAESPWKGKTWSFTVSNYVGLDDFETYADTDELKERWDDWEINDSGAMISLETEPALDSQSMLFDYDNWWEPQYSEADLRFDSPQDWTIKDTRLLSVRFIGLPHAATVGGVVGGCETGWDGWTATGPWHIGTVDAAGIPPQPTPCGATDTYYLGWPNEMGTGTLTSPTFTVEGETIEVWLNGWDGPPGGELGQNLCYLKSAADDTVLRSASPPQATSVFVKTVWDVNDLKGQEVYFEAIDGAAAGGFAWFGVALVEEVAEGAEYVCDTPVYLVIEDADGTDVTIDYNDAAYDKDLGWQYWQIPLPAISDAGVDLTRVTRLSIGLGGPEDSGQVYFDNIRLLPPTCILDNRPETFAAMDYNNDCVIDLSDLSAITGSWLVGDYTIAAKSPDPNCLQGRWEFENDFNDTKGLYESIVAGDPNFGPGVIGDYALQLDGDGDCVGVAIPDINDTAYAVSLWFKSSSEPSGVFQVTQLGTGSFDRHIALRADGNIVSFVWQSEGIVTSGADYSGQWHHVVHTFGGDVGGQRLYVDGVLRATGFKDYSDFDWHDGVMIGYSAMAAGGTFFTGLIDDVRLYKCALSEAEVAYLAAKGADELHVSVNQTIAAPYNLFDDEVINFKDIAIMGDSWLEDILWP